MTVGGHNFERHGLLPVARATREDRLAGQHGDSGLFRDADCIGEPTSGPIPGRLRSGLVSVGQGRSGAVLSKRTSLAAHLEDGRGISERRARSVPDAARLDTSQCGRTVRQVVTDRTRRARAAIWVLWLGWSAAAVTFGAVVLVSSLWANPWCRSTVAAEDSPGVGLPYFSEWPFGPGCYTPGGPDRPPSWWWSVGLLVIVASGAALWLVHRRGRGPRAPKAQQE